MAVSLCGETLSDNGSGQFGGGIANESRDPLEKGKREKLVNLQLLDKFLLTREDSSDKRIFTPKKDGTI